MGSSFQALPENSHESLSGRVRILLTRVSLKYPFFTAEVVNKFLGFAFDDLAVCQNLVPLVNIKIAGKWMFIPLKMYL